MSTHPEEPTEPSDRLDPEIPNPDVPVDDSGDDSGDPADVPDDPDVDPTARREANDIVWLTRRVFSVRWAHCLQQ